MYNSDKSKYNVRYNPRLGPKLIKIYCIHVFKGIENTLDQYNSN